MNEVTHSYIGSNIGSPADSDPWQTVGADPWIRTSTSTPSQSSQSHWYGEQLGSQNSWFGAPSTPQRPLNSLRPDPNTPTCVSREADDSGTSTDTESDYADDLEAGELALYGIDASWTDQQIAEEVFWQYQRAKRTWRRFSKKPTRKVRRFLRRRKGKGIGSSHSFGSGKGKGKKRFQFLAELSDDEYQSIFVIGKGKGGKRSSGKGKGRKLNPIDPTSGERMLCSICEAEDHFKARCPRGTPARPTSHRFHLHPHHLLLCNP